MIHWSGLQKGVKSRVPHPFGSQLLGPSEQWGLWNTPEGNPGKSSSAASIDTDLIAEGVMRKKRGENHIGSLRGSSTRCLYVTKVTRINQNLASRKVTLTWVPSPIRKATFIQRALKKQVSLHRKNTPNWSHNPSDGSQRSPDCTRS